MVYKRKSIIPDFYYGAKPHIFVKTSELRKSMTLAEKILWSVLRKKQIKGYHFRRQHPISRFIADFYSHKARLVIEVDGEGHLQKDQQEYDIGRSNNLEEFGIKVIRFTNNQVIEDLEKVIYEIESILE